MGSYPEEGYVEWCAEQERIKTQQQKAIKKLDACTTPLCNANSVAWAKKPDMPSMEYRDHIKARLFDIIIERHPNILHDIFNEVSKHD